MNTTPTVDAGGLLMGFSAYALWGMFPLFFHALSHVPSTEVLLHRVLWSLLFCLLIVLARRGWPTLRAALSNRNLLRGLLLSALLISVNWLVYIWAVADARVLESSLGYFITPLVSVFLARVFLGELMNRWQAVAVALAALGVAWLLIRLGYLPWVSLSLALSFGLYGLVRKRLKVDTLTGLTVETALLAPLAMAYAIWLNVTQQQSFLHLDLMTDMLLLSCGVVTAIPLLLFAAAAHRLSLTILGFMMYLNPTLQFLLALWVLNEPLSSDMLIAFGFIWAALVVFTLGTLKRKSGQRSTEV